MPFKSEAQRKKFQGMLGRGEISQETYDEWDRETPGELPDRVTSPRRRARPDEMTGLSIEVSEKKRREEQSKKRWE